MSQTNHPVSVAIVDAFQDASSKTFTFKAYDFSMNETYEMWSEQIQLFEKTARTNILIRDRNGRFMSYKNLPELFDAVLSRKPFPTSE